MRNNSHMNLSKSVRTISMTQTSLPSRWTWARKQMISKPLDSKRSRNNKRKIGRRKRPRKQLRKRHVKRN